MSNDNIIIADDYFVTHPPFFTIEKVSSVAVSRTIFLEKNGSTLAVSSDAKFEASRLNGEKYENLINTVYPKFGIKLLEGTQDNEAFQLQSRGTILQEVLACDGYNPNKTKKLRLRIGTEFNAEKSLNETAFVQGRIWKGDKYGLRSSMTRALLRYFHHAIPLGLNLDRFYAIFFEVSPQDVMRKANTYIMDGHSRHTAYAQAINITYNNYQTADNKYKRLQRTHSAYINYNFLPRRPDGRRKQKDFID